MLDSQIKDKDQEKGVLYARIKILEEKQNKVILDKYFPLPPADNPGSTSPTSCRTSAKSPSQTSKPCSPSPTCACSVTPPGCSTAPCTTPLCSSLSTCQTSVLLLHLLNQGQSQHVHPCRSQASSPAQDTNYHQSCTALHDELRHTIKNNEAEIIKLKDELKDLKSIRIDVSPKPSTSSNVPPAVNPNGFSQAEGKTETTVNLDESIASTEELIEDISGDSPPSDQLNCQVPTTQLDQLKQ